MRIAYVHGYDGVTGPLLLSACLDAGAPLEAFQEGWRQLQLPATQIAVQRLASAQGMAMQVQPLILPESVLRGRLRSTALVAQIEASQVVVRVKQRLVALLRHFTSTLARFHGVREDDELVCRSALLPELVYWGSGVVCALEALAVEYLVAAPIPIRCGPDHRPQAVAPEFQPLTVELCRGLPIYGQQGSGETTTVIGAAILAGLSNHVGPVPVMTVTGTGHGISTPGTSDTSQHLHIFLGDLEGPAQVERIAVIEANIDDMNPEFYEAIFANLFAKGALDVTLTPLFMKKNRPANTLTVLAPLVAVSSLSQAMLQETSTFGVRVHEVWRHKLERFYRHVDTCYGSIAVKCGMLAGRIVQAAPEYEACKRAAQERQVPVRLVYAEAARLAAPWLT